MHENDIAKIVVDAAFRVHNVLGPGLFESVYEAALFLELTRYRGLAVNRQVSVPATYRGVDLGLAFRADLVVEDKVIIELKSLEMVLKVHKKQVITYLKLTDCKLGLLINFNENLIKDGITRIVNGL